MPIPVKATQLGFFGNKLRYENEEFAVDNEDQLGTWMHRLDGGPDREATVPTAPAEARLALLENENAILREKVKALGGSAVPQAPAGRPGRKAAPVAEPVPPTPDEPEQTDRPDQNVI
jgi:hypothetical protein